MPRSRLKKFKPVYRYRLTNTNHSSSKFGPCEVCQKHVSEVWFQVEERSYQPYPDDDPSTPWTRVGCTTLFGHRRCLVAKRRKPARKWMP